MDIKNQEKAVTDKVSLYISALENSEFAKDNIERAFYSSTNLHSLSEDGSIHFIPRDALVEYAVTNNAEVVGSILSVEVVNDMAFAKVKLELSDFYWVDYLTLLKIKGDWLIVSKTFTTINK